MKKFELLGRKLNSFEQKEIVGGDAYSTCTTSCPSGGSVSSSCAGSCKTVDNVRTYCQGSDGSEYNEHKCEAGPIGSIG